MKQFSFDIRNGGPNSDRATDSQIKRLMELKITFNPLLTWLEAKKLIKDYHQANKMSKDHQQGKKK